MIVHVLSGWLASSYPIRRSFLHHISERVSVESVRKNERVLAISHEGMASLLDVCSSYKYCSDIGLFYQSKIIF